MIIYVMINYPYTCLTSDDSVLFNPRMHRQSMDPNRTYMINDSKRIALIGSSITTVEGVGTELMAMKELESNTAIF